MAEMLYFAKDGSYGSASDLTILNTEHWTEEDWQEIEQASDMTRWHVAVTRHGEAVRRAMLSAIGVEKEA